MSAQAAVDAVQAAALKNWRGNGQRWAFAVDATSLASNAKKPTVLVAIVTAWGSMVVAVDADQWLGKVAGEEPGWQFLTEFVGVLPYAPPPAIERATVAKSALVK